MTAVAGDVFHWGVTYQDGSRLQEFDARSAIGCGWAEIGEKPVKDIWLLRRDADLGQGHRVSVPAGATPVFVRRRRIALSPDGAECGRETVHVIGWRQGERGAYLFIFADGSTLLSADFNAV